MSIKGDPAKLLSGSMYKKTKDHSMIALSYQNRSKPIIGLVPILHPIQTPPLSSKPQKVVKFQHNISQVDSTTTTLPWLVDCCCFQVNENTAIQSYEKYTPESILHLNNHVKALSYHLISFLPSFLYDWLPPSRTGLLPGSHWVWNSLRNQIKPIVTIMWTSICMRKTC